MRWFKKKESKEPEISYCVPHNWVKTDLIFTEHYNGVDVDCETYYELTCKKCLKQKRLEWYEYKLFKAAIIEEEINR